jgi:hypothetical protein
MNEEIKRITAANQVVAVAEAIVRTAHGRHRAEPAWRSRSRVARKFVKAHPWAFTSLAVLAGLVVAVNL